MWMTKRRLELEKTVAVQDELAKIIRKSNTKEPYAFEVTVHSQFEPTTTTKYTLEVTEKESWETKEKKV